LFAKSNMHIFKNSFLSSGNSLLTSLIIVSNSILAVGFFESQNRTKVFYLPLITSYVKVLPTTFNTPSYSIAFSIESDLKNYAIL
jgi:hypothetical protein